MKILRHFVEVFFAISALMATQVYAQTTYLHGDLLGSIVMETNSSGAVTKTLHYEPFGNPIGTLGEDEPGFTSHVHDDSIELTYMQARYYDPLMGRFYSADPVDFMPESDLSFNRYSYGYNNPFKYTDPTGEVPFLIPVVIFIAKELAAEGASQLTGGATDFLSLRRMGTKALKFGAKKVSKQRTAYAPVGRSGQQTQFPNPNAPQPRNAPEVIGDRNYSGHAIDRMQERGYTPSVIENAIRNGTGTPGNSPGTTEFFDSTNNFRVIVNTDTGRVITIIPGGG